MARQEISRLEKLAEGVWVLVSRAPKPPLYCNSLIVELSDRSVAVDSHHSLEGARLLLNAIAQTTGKPPRHLILTHHHRDHAGGRGAFPESADIIAHENARLHLGRVVN
jgi:glyoxylase-like metal-dependent hydrolase (beta-lactamase superfamily II)